jgi:putative FmdB family regulatory protein
MPIYEFRCDYCGHEHEDLVKIGTKTISCPECTSNSRQVILTAPKIDWGAMGAQKNVSPEFIDRFEKVHKERTEKEAKTYEEHGDYGPEAGS